MVGSYGEQRFGEQRFGEQRWIDQIRARFPGPAGILGPGDDAALLTPRPGEVLVLTVDAMVEGTHFVDGWLTDDELAARSLRVSLSDLAAMAAAPRGALISIETPSLPGRVGERFWDGVAETLECFSFPLLGGNVTRTSGPLAITTTLIGGVAAGREARRSGAQAGDSLWVTGVPGRAALARRALIATSEAGGAAKSSEAATRPYRRPEPRLDIAQALNDRACLGACIDLSDGLGVDACRLLDDSGVGAEIDLAPLLVQDSDLDVEVVLDGGEDYELLFAVPAGRDPDPETLREQFGVDLTRLGQCHDGSGLRIRVGGEVRSYQPRGWDPFRSV